MGGGPNLKKNEKVLIDGVISLACELNLQFRLKFLFGTAIWRRPRKVDVLLFNNEKRLGVSCIYQAGSGSAHLKFYAFDEDRKIWKDDNGVPLDGVIVFDGPGFPKEFPKAMLERGALPLEGLGAYLRSYFCIKESKNT